MLWFVLYRTVIFWRTRKLLLNWVEISWKDSKFFFLLALAVHLIILWFAIRGIIYFFVTKH
jgi:hypothetical protein